jgi:uncharacterized RDD family membrane protein YckC
LSTLPAPQPSWKQEVNKRLEEHKNRRGISVVEQSTQAEDRSAVSDRAAKAAARVAARFSKAPSYSEMQAAEARTALRTAEAATRAALEAQAVAQAALASLTATEEEYFDHVEEYPAHESVPESTQAPWESAPVRTAISQDAGRSWEIRWDPDLPERAVAPASMAAHSQPMEQEHAVVTVEPAQPIHANLIHFPRELVATRRMRPRLASTQAGEASEQLSIFEVDPSSISIDPTASANDPADPADSWCGPGWSSIHLDAQPRKEPEAHHNPVPSTASAVHLAPLELRLMAAAIDIALIVCLVCAAVAGVAGHIHSVPTIRFAEAGALGAVILMGILYQAFFLLTMRSTPGMMYAGIALCTFDDEHPTRAQLRNRLGAFLVSILPVGLGMAWAIFDEDHLSWHDRLSRTYQRKC